jgi:putative phosphoesterase
MRVAILSDIHDNIWKLEAALEEMRADVLLFCGDFCAPFTLRQLAEGFAGPVHVVFGNNDGDQLLLCRVAAEYDHVSLHGEFAELELDGRRVAVTHYPEIAEAFASGDRFDLVCHGHNHERIIERRSETMLVNPGEVMGRLGTATYAVYDTRTGGAEFVDIP